MKLVIILHLAAASTAVFGQLTFIRIFYTHGLTRDDNKRLLMVTWSKNGKEPFSECKILDDEKSIEKILKFVPGHLIDKISKTQMENIFEYCAKYAPRDTRLRRSSQDSLKDSTICLSSGCRSNGINSILISSMSAESIDAQINEDQNLILNSSRNTWAPSTTRQHMPIIFPGTKWCGNDNIAENIDDLGSNKELDKCCHDHDLCDDKLLSGEAKYNLSNNSPVVRMNCRCDSAFYECLKSVNSYASNLLKFFYFDFISSECFEENYPINKKCKKYKTLFHFKLECEEYERNTSAPRVYHWVSSDAYVRFKEKNNYFPETQPL